MATSIATLESRIEAIRECLRSGVTMVTVDGTTTQIDPASLRQELKQLQSELDTAQGNVQRRPAVATVKLGGF